MTFKSKREAAGLKQVEVAEKLGISNTAISMWETGDSRPRTELLPRIAALYGCTVDELLADSDAQEGA